MPEDLDLAVFATGLMFPRPFATSGHESLRVAATFHDCPSRDENWARLAPDEGPRACPACQPTAGLHNIYRKIDVRSRTELDHRLAHEGAVGEPRELFDERQRSPPGSKRAR